MDWQKWFLIVKGGSDLNIGTSFMDKIQNCISVSIKHRLNLVACERLYQSNDFVAKIKFVHKFTSNRSLINTLLQLAP